MRKDNVAELTIKKLKNHADNYCHKNAKELYENGYMEQELDTIYEDIESFVRGELCAWDRTNERYISDALVDGAEYIAETYCSEWEEEVEERVDNSISLVEDFLRTVED